jgi:hypothetical protein
MPLPSPLLFPDELLFPGDEISIPGPVTQGLLNSAAPFTAQSADLITFLTALGEMFDLVYGLVANQGYSDDDDYIPGWSILLDPDNCPAQFLPYLGQFNGTVVPPGTDEATARAIVKSESGMQRGTGIGGTYDSSTYPAGGAIVAAAQRNLTGTQNVTLIERMSNSGADAYSFLLIVRPEQLLSATALTNAINAVKPAGIVWTLVQSDGEIWSAASRTWASDTTTWAQKD